jgi:hypothetical protein
MVKKFLFVSSLARVLFIRFGLHRERKVEKNGNETESCITETKSR